MNEDGKYSQIEKQAGHLLDEIVSMSEFTFDRLPMLDIIGERVASNLSNILSDMTDVQCEVELNEITYAPMGKVQESLPASAIISVGSGEPLDGQMLVIIDRVFLMTTLELVLGGSVGRINVEEKKPFTAIDLNIGEMLSRGVLSAFQQGMLVVCNPLLEIDRLETEIEAAHIAKPSDLCTHMRFSVNIAKQKGQLDIICPYEALEPIRMSLSKIYLGERDLSDNPWQELLDHQIRQARLTAEVVMAERSVSLSKIMSWKPGDVWEVGIKEDQEAILVCADEPLFAVTLGKRNNGFIAVQVSRKLNEAKETENADSTH